MRRAFSFGFWQLIVAASVLWAGAGCSGSSDSGLFLGKGSGGSSAGNPDAGEGTAGSVAAMACADDSGCFNGSTCQSGRCVAIGAGGSGNAGGGGARNAGGTAGSSVRGTGGGGGAGGEACVTAASAERLPPDLFVLLDTSGSMNEAVASSAAMTKWDVVSSALVEFLNAPANAGTAVGLGYFPNVDATAPTACTTDTDCVTPTKNWGTCTGTVLPGFGCLACTCSLAAGCELQNYTPPAVPLALPPNPSAVAASIAARALPTGGTPTRPGLEATLTYAASWRTQHPERSLAVLLVTDGTPTGCSVNAVTDVANVAAAALAGPQHLKTFVIGVGSSLDSLNQVAVSGGTNHAYVLDTTANVGDALKAALGEIRVQVTGCTYSLPPPHGADPGAIDVFYTDPTNAAGAETPIARTSDGTGKTCAAGVGWYPTGAGALASIDLCPESCALVGTGSLRMRGTCGAGAQ